MRRLLALTTLAVLLAGPALAEDQPATLSLTGTGTVVVTPDMATVSIGVETQHATAGGALSANSQATHRVIETLKSAGTAAKDIQTQNFAVFPVYTDRRNAQAEPPKIAGYRVTNQVSAQLNDLDALGALLDQVVQAGANRINGISFSVQDPAAAEELARIRAVEDATAKARTYAEAASVGLGDILSISEGGSHQPPQPRFAAMRAEAQSVPIERGTQAITATVQMIWEIEPADP